MKSVQPLSQVMGVLRRQCLILASIARSLPGVVTG